MRNGGSRIRESHHGAGLALAAGALLLLLTGLGLQHPQWFGRGALPPRAVAADPEVPGRLLRASAALLEESRDGGGTWRDLPLLLAPTTPLGLAFAPASAGKVWLLGERELLHSRDGGHVWEPVDLPGDIGRDESAVSLAVTASGRPLVVGEFGGWRLEPDGQWRLLWRVEPSGGDRLRTWIRRLHTGRWGGAAVLRLYDAGVILGVVVVISGLVLARRRMRRRRRR
jgi:hypothetical protein